MIMHLCNPALLYFILAIMSILTLIIHKTSATVIIAKIIGVLLWTWFLNFVCGKGFTNVSWGLVVAPYVIIFIALVTGIVKMSDLQVEQPKKEDNKEPLVIL
jgi:hypothetical protein